MKRRQQKGFTLIEMAVAVAIVGILASISMPLFSRLQRAQTFRSVTRSIQSELINSRSAASSGRHDPSWGATDRVLQAGLRVVSTTSYVMFIDRDAVQDGDEVTTRTVVLPQGVEITSPAVGQEIRFRHNGTVVAPLSIVVADRYRAKTRTLVVSGGGSIRAD